MDIQVIYDQKMVKLLSRSWLFNLVPFLDSVFVAGSLAMGNVHRDSDFDVIVRTANGKLYTSRFFCLLLFSIFNWRRSVENSRDGFCFNCFITRNEKQVILNPHNKYASKLSNSLMAMETSGNAFAKGLEYFLSKKIGLLTENLLKSWQLKKIEKNLKKFNPHANSRIVISDNRVEVCLYLKDILD